MADTKISALTAATTPLDGTEVLPIVQSSTTKKVANNDLRPKQIQSNATSGVMQILGPAAAATCVMTIPNSNFTVARTDAAQSFIGDQTLSTGNLIQGTAAKGFNFTANSAAAGKTSQLLNWYEEGSFTPSWTSLTTVGALTTEGRYTRIGNLVYITVYVKAATSTASTANSTYFTGLPFNVKTSFASTISAVGNWNVSSLGVGLIDTSNSVYTPTWSSGANQTVSISGFYQVA